METSNDAIPGVYEITVFANGGLTKSVTVTLHILPITIDTFFTDSAFADLSNLDVVFTTKTSSGESKFTATNPGTYFHNSIVTNVGDTEILLGTSLTVQINFSGKKKP